MSNAWFLNSRTIHPAVSLQQVELSSAQHRGNVSQLTVLILMCSTAQLIIQAFWSKTYCSASEICVSSAGHGSSNRRMTGNINLKSSKEWMRRKHWTSLRRSAMSPNPNPTEHLRKELKPAVGRRHPPKKKVSSFITYVITVYVLSTPSGRNFWCLCLFFVICSLNSVFLMKYYIS